MSLHILSDENVTGDKSTENCDFLFSPLELTGRPSVLRLSQKENVPPRSTAKAVKVTFQTPLRDPQTQRILSPNVGSKLEACFALGDPTGLENCHQVCAQKENQQFTKETDTKTTHGILQKPVPANAEPPSEDMRPASEDQPPGGPPSAPLVSLGPSSFSQIPESVENTEASQGPAPGSPECAREEHVHPRPSEESMPLSPTAPEQPPGVASQDAAEDPLSTMGGDSKRVPAPPTRPASPSGAHPREKPLVDLPGVAPADSKEAASCEDTALTSPREAAEATHPSARGDEASGQAAGSLRSGPVRLEFDFSDAAGKRPPPLRKRGKTLGLKPPLRRPEARPGKAPLEAGKGCELALHESNGLSWDKPDNPDCNPAADSGEAQPPGHPQSGQAAEALALSRQECSDDTPTTMAPARTPGAAGEGGTSGSSGSSAPLSSPSSEPPTAPTDPTPRAKRGPEPILDLSGEQFRDPVEVLGAGAEVDYLEQFGASSFKESALRKQSLYLNFDPLLQDSPRGLALSRGGPPDGPRGPPVPSVGPLASEQSPSHAQRAGGVSPSLRAQGVGAPLSGSPLEAQLLDLDFPGAPGVPMPGPAPCDLGPGAPLLPVGPIVDVLQYSQKDLDSAVEATQKENEALRGKCTALQERLLEMGKIMDSFERTVYQVMGECQSPPLHGGGGRQAGWVPSLMLQCPPCSGGYAPPGGLHGYWAPAVSGLEAPSVGQVWAQCLLPRFLGVWSPEGPPQEVPRGRCPAAHRSEVLISSPEEAQKQEELTKAEMQKILKDKAQLTADLHSMEKSFSDLFKRFEKQKEVIEGYRTVGAGQPRGGGGAQQEGLSTALGRSLAGSQARRWARLSPASARTLGSPLVTCNWTRVPTRHPCGPAQRPWVCAGCCAVPHPQAAGHPAPRAWGWGNGTGCSVGLVPDPVSPMVPGGNPVVGP
ncbi:transforming acidic coiled-coil-containing protein 3 isoform X2 [Moschus berezovskii]|uniref:transforming acidic coiled-coil-containing protein 3 isoform X2 n=1 Tax=Moschus berezovskii TaxID=68408 RepID=UPI002443F184|nr:transforming acidic coiled-coil-containing protein 3 isoform X2 [Moschus berezovskii]